MKGKWRGPDLVALILAIGLALVALLILLATIVQILYGGRPEVSLSENATQVLVGATGGLVGVLGGYMGYRLGNREGPKDDD